MIAKTKTLSRLHLSPNPEKNRVGEPIFVEDLPAPQMFP